MVNDFYEACYEICSLSTCLLNDNENDQRNAKVRIKITANLEVEAIYSYYYNLLSNIERHGFYLDFYKDNKYIGCVRYSKNFNQLKHGSLARRNMKINSKLNAITRSCSPNFIDKNLKIVDTLSLIGKLTFDEIRAIYQKNEELYSNYLDLKNQKELIKVK